ncbi:sensor histidine kinase [Vallitalea pronyensis]|uniref:histidine kinase n=1 Tax=Vallitalea pronyensis TaxID=1348613 RepID=A0A8J8SHE2_9FIRM|nr:sensor histidine kinase [Vallitalea pronyensis]QUI23486.1 sensor histidine kinase [Vallitalea pronyensis]
MKLKRIGVRITMYYSLVILVLILIISISLSYVFSDEIIVQNNKIANHKIDIITYNIGAEIDNIKDLHKEITQNPKIKGLLNRAYEGEKSIELVNVLSRELLNYKQKTPYIVNLFFVDIEDHILDPLYRLDYYNEIISNNHEFEQYKQDKYRAKFSNPTSYPIKNSYVNNNIIYYGQVLRDDDYRLLGYLILNLRIEILFSEIEAFCQEAFDAAYIVNENDTIIHYIGEEDEKEPLSFINHAINPEESLYKKDNERYFVYERPIEKYPLWKIVGINKYDTVMSNMTTLYRLVIYIGLISIIVIIWVSFFIAKKITNPIRDVSSAMKKFEHFEWPEVIEPKTEDELKNLVSGFNKMVINIKRLTHQIERETEERKKVELASLQFQLELLQSQINPHFIHNTLNSMQYLALRDNAHDVREMIRSLNLLLRGSMSVGTEVIPLEEELKYLDGYINIQKNRYKDRFEVVKEISDDIYPLQVPKLILQPLVENALYHGILPKEKKGIITVYIKKESDAVVFKIMDDGIGMDKKRLETIYHKKQSKRTSGYNHIGLSNVNERLKLYFGANCRLDISSEPGVGTCVMFKIPLDHHGIEGH